MKPFILLVSLFVILCPSQTFSQEVTSTFDSYYIKPFVIYDVGFYFPQENDPLGLRDTNSFFTTGIEAGLAKSNNFAVGLSISLGNETGEMEDDLIFGTRDYGSYLRILLTTKKSLIRTRAKSKFQVALGISGAGGYVRFSGLEGTGETSYNPETGRDRFLSKDVIEHAPYTSGGLYGEVGGKVSENVSIGLTYHFIEATVSTAHYGFNLAKTGLNIRF